MIIFGFDCAVENMGICIVRLNDTWRENTNAFIHELHDLYERLPSMDKTTFLSEATDIVRKIDEFAKTFFRIEWFNVVDLIPGQ